MTEIPLPSFEILTKFYNWLTEQAKVWFFVVSDTKTFLSGLDLNSTTTLGRSVQLLSFSVALIVVSTFPIDALLWRIRPFDATATILDLILIILSIIIFSVSVYLFSKCLLGKGRLAASIASMFYATAFMPFLYLLHYLDRLDPDFRKLILSGDYFGQSAIQTLYNPRSIIVALIQLPVFIYVTIKIVNIVRFVHEIDIIRAIIVVCLAGIVEQSYEYVVLTPIFAEIVRDFGIH